MHRYTFNAKNIDDNLHASNKNHNIVFNWYCDLFRKCPNTSTEMTSYIWVLHTLICDVEHLFMCLKMLILIVLIMAWLSSPQDGYGCVHECKDHTCVIPEEDTLPPTAEWCQQIWHLKDIKPHRGISVLHMKAPTHSSYRLLKIELLHWSFMHKFLCFMQFTKKKCSLTRQHYTGKMHT